MRQSNPGSEDEMRPEYDSSAGVRGKHHEQFKAGTNVAFLDADIAKVLQEFRVREPRAQAASRPRQEPVATGPRSIISAGNKCAPGGPGHAHVNAHSLVHDVPIT